MARIRKNGKPTTKTVGVVGDIYVDRLSGLTYKCTLAYGVGHSDREYIWKETEEVEKIPNDTPIDIPEPEEEVTVEQVQPKRNNYRNNFKNNKR